MPMPTFKGLITALITPFKDGKVDGRIVLEPPAVPMRLGRRGKGVVVVPSKSLPRLRTSQVRAVLESGRR